MISQMRLWELHDQFVFQPDGASDHQQLLSINRATGEASLIPELPLTANQQLGKSLVVYGLLGAIRLLTGTHVLVVTGRECVGSYRGAPVFKVTSMKFLECEHRSVNLSLSKRTEEHYLRGLLKLVPDTPGLLFSYETDLTNNAQRAHRLRDAHQNQPLLKQADPMFLWNGHLMEHLLEFKEYILPVIQGSFQIFQALVGDRLVQLTLIARRCPRRAGTRMWRRGADKDGSAANFVETEQILEACGYFASYVLVRGSIPVFWEQIVDLTYKPKIESIPHDQTAVERHFEGLSERYGSVLAIDLINQQGSEGVLSIAYRNAMQQLQNDSVRYVPFDFHKICGNVRFDRLSVLHDQISEDLLQQRFFLTNPVGEVVEEQRGLVRANCIDCLDRTNVTQSLLGRKSLEAQLRHIGLFSSSETIDGYRLLDTQFNIMWANHGDDISYQYAGTPALKGDFVRYGKRSLAGLIQDGLSSLGRYYLNNFKDGFRQDAIDLVAGHYRVSEDSSPHQSVIAGIASYFPVVAAVVLLCSVFTMLSMWRVSRGESRGLYTVAWATITAVIGAVVRTNGRQLCSRPRLKELK